jgi:hypothetical protein
MVEKYYTFVIEQFIGGVTTELIKVQTENTVSRLEALEYLEKLTKQIHDSASMHLIIENKAVIFSPAQGPISIKIEESED